jgi:hypothetical protein
METGIFRADGKVHTGSRHSLFVREHCDSLPATNVITITPNNSLTIVSGVSG